jgi:hypothetical protein
MVELSALGITLKGTLPPSRTDRSGNGSTDNCPETWTPIPSPDWALAGHVHAKRDRLPERKVAFAGPGGQMLFRLTKEKVVVDLTGPPPDDPVLENGNKLLQNKPVAI